MRKFIYLAVIAASTFVLVQSCKKSGSGDTAPGSSFDRKGLLTNLSTNIIIPAYTAFQTASVNLDAAITAFNASPDLTKLAAAQAALKVAYQQWQSTSAFGFGPAEPILFRDNTNTFPAGVAQINANISTNTYDPALAANLKAKGLPAMDYLLFGVGADNNAILLQYTTDANTANRKAYLAKLSAEMKTNATTVLTAWNSTTKTNFVNADGTDIGSSVGIMVNQLVLDFENLKNYEIGVPVGTLSMGTLFPEKVQAYYSQTSLQLALLHLQAIQNIYLGKSAAGDGLGLDDYLVAANAKYNGGSLNDAIKAQFATATTKLQALNDPLSTQVTTNTAAVTAAYTELQKLTVMLKTDMTSSLGILITYGDNDGD